MKRRFEPAVKPLVCVLGGSGFVGGHLAALLTAHGYRVRIPTRRATRHAALRVLPGVDLVETDIHDAAALREVLRGCTAAVNLVAILNEGHAGDFQRVHVELPRRLAALCREGGVRRLLHMSALNADAARGTSRYLRTKGEGEDLMHQAEGLQVTSFRPSVIFGPGDHLFNRFARLLKLSPIMPLACPQARFAPVFVGDVAQAMRSARLHPQGAGGIYRARPPAAPALRRRPGAGAVAPAGGSAGTSAGQGLHLRQLSVPADRRGVRRPLPRDLRHRAGGGGDAGTALPQAPRSRRPHGRIPPPGAARLVTVSPPGGF
jgi:uncharacterized protein YbjT (DUF2867 family)